MNKVSHTILPPPPPAHSRRAAHFLKPLPIAALAALLAAPAAWANSGGDSFTDYYGDSAYGGFGSGKTVIYDENDTVDTAYGGYSDTNPTDPKVADKTGKANGNKLTVTGTVDKAYGGAAFDTGGKAEANGNTVTVKGTVTTTAFGGYSKNGSASGNFVFIDGGTAKNAQGGFAFGGDSEGNTVTLISGEVTNGVTGGGCSGSGCKDVGNTLAVQGKDFPVGGYVQRFDTLNFTLPAGITNGDVMLSVGEDATFGKSPSHAATVSIALADGAWLKKDDTITLVKANTNGGSYKLSITPTLKTVPAGYEFVLDASDGINLIAKVTKVPPPLTVTGKAVPAEGGEVDCGATEVARGGTITCTAKAKPGHIYDDNSIRLESGAATVACSGASCTLTNVTSNVKVSATFTKVPVTHNITASVTPAGSGSITCTPTTVEDGKNVTITCTAAPSSGYKLDGLSLDGVSCGSTTTCTATAVANDLNVDATFSLDEYSVTDATPDGAGGTMECPGTTVTYFGSTTCTAKPDAGYTFVKATLIGNATMDACPDGVCTLTDVLGDVGVTGTFVKDGEGGGSTQTPCPTCDNSSPTMGELGLLLSGIALAGAAAPALRRRERKARKQD